MSAENENVSDADLLRETLHSTTDAFDAPGHVSHELLAQLLALSSQAFVIGYPDGTLGLMNAAFEKLTGYTAAELEHISWATTLTPPEWREFERQKVEELNRTGLPVRYEKEYIRKDGSRVPIELHVHRVPDPSGELYYFSFLTDISERKRFEKEILASEERFRSVLENAADCIYRFNYETQRYDYVSPSCSDTIGYSLQEFLAFDIEDAMATVHPDDRDRVRDSFFALRPKTRVEIDYRQVDSKGTYRWLSNHVTLVNDENGRPLYRYGNVRDITERKRIELERQQLEIERAQVVASQLKISETIQRSLLRAPEPDAYPGIISHPFYQAAYDDALVGGDFYDIYPVAENLVALIVGDATGKGVAAAVHTAEVKFALRAYLKEYVTDVATAVGKLNRFIVENIELDAAHNANGCIALVAAVLNVETGELTCTCAGAEPPLILRQGSGRVEEVCEYGALLGLDENAAYSSSTYLLSAGDVITLTTDGVTEAHRQASGQTAGQMHESDFYGLSGVADALKAANPISADAIPPLQRRIVEESIAWAGGSQRDDICLLTTKLLG